MKVCSKLLRGGGEGMERGWRGGRRGGEGVERGRRGGGEGGGEGEERGLFC